MKIRFKQIRSLSYPNKWLLLQGLFLSCLLRLSFKLINFKKTIAILSRFKRKGAALQVESTGHDVGLYRHLIILSYSFTPVINCLSISTAYWWLMKKNGIVTDLKFGMRTEQEKLLAHAWLEYEGKSLTADVQVEKKYTVFKGSIL